MIEIADRLHIGDQHDYECDVSMQRNSSPLWSIVQACKEPYHRMALGYVGRGAPKDHPEYQIAVRGNRMILNLVDTPDPKYISAKIIDRALVFTRRALAEGRRVLVHYNQGMSRSATIGLLYMATQGYYNGMDFADAEIAFLERYPLYNPGSGMRGFADANWERYNPIGGVNHVAREKTTEG